MLASLKTLAFVGAFALVPSALTLTTSDNAKPSSKMATNTVKACKGALIALVSNGSCVAGLQLTITPTPSAASKTIQLATAE